MSQPNDPNALHETVEPIELTPAPRRTEAKRSRAVLAGIAAIAVLAAATGVIAATDDGPNSATGGLAKLRLTGTAKESPRSANAAGNADSAIYPYRIRKYVHSGAWPNLPTTAPVATLRAGAMDAGRAADVADAFGVQGSAKAVTEGWVVSDGTRTVTINKTPGGWAVGLFVGTISDSGDTSGGSSGSGGAGVSPGSTGADGSASAPGAGPDAAAPPRVETPTTQPAEPQDLPSDAEAEQLARATLERLGFDTSAWNVTVASWDTSVSVACDSAVKTDGAGNTVNSPCVETPVDPVVTQRNVTLVPTFHGKPTSGMEWNITYGDHSSIESAYGTIATLDELGDYPLRSIDAAYDELVEGGGPIAMAEGNIQPKSAVSAEEPARDTMIAECPDNAACAPIDPTTPAEPITVTITDVRLAFQVQYGLEGSDSVAYLVPVYRFVESIDGVTEGEPSDDVLALDPKFLDTGDATTTTLAGGTIEPGTTPETKPEILTTTPEQVDPTPPVPAPDVPTTVPVTTIPETSTTVGASGTAGG